MKGILEGFAGIADLFTSWWGLFLGIGLLLALILVIYVMYLFIVSFVFIDMPVNSTAQVVANVTA